MDGAGVTIPPLTEPPVQLNVILKDSIPVVVMLKRGGVVTHLIIVPVRVVLTTGILRSGNRKV